MQVLLTRTRHGFVPADEQAQDELARVKIGTSVLCEIKRSRNPRQHALMFAALHNLFENQRGQPEHQYRQFDSFYLAVKDALGWFDPVSIKGGTQTAKDYWSLSFAQMPQEKFEPCLGQVLDLTVRVLGVSKEEARREAEVRATGLPASIRNAEIAP